MSLFRRGYFLFCVTTFLWTGLLSLVAYYLPPSGPKGIIGGEVLWMLPALLSAWLVTYLFCCWYLLRRDSEPTMRALLLGALVVALPFLFSAPLSSTDLYANAYHGRLVSMYHINPYGISDQVQLDDVYFNSTRARAPYQTTYGPLWITTAAAITAKTGDHIGLTLFLFRGLNLLALLGIILLLGRVLRSKGRARWVLAFVALNPLVLFEGIQNGHNDLLMAFFVVAALVAILRNKPGLLLPLLTLGALIKYLPVLLFPLVVVAIWKYYRSLRERLRSLFLGVGISLGLAIVAFFPYWIGGSTFHELRLLGFFWALPFFHPVQITEGLFQWIGMARDAARVSARAATQALFLLFIAWTLLWYVRNKVTIAAAAFLTLLAFFGTGITYFQPWYFLWLLPIVPLLPERWQIPTLFGATFLPLATYPLYMLP